MHSFRIYFSLLIALSIAFGSKGQIVSVKSWSKISETQGGFSDLLGVDDRFGRAVNIGDLNNDGQDDFAVGARRHDDGGGFDEGAIWILFMDANDSVIAQQKISDTQGNFTPSMHSDFKFGGTIEPLGDLDGDGIEDIVVGAPGDDDGGNLQGSLFVLFLDTNGTVKSHQKISDTQGNFSPNLDPLDEMGWNITNLGDLNGDSIVDIAISAISDDDGGTNRGAAYVIFLDTNGTAKSTQKISDTQGGFTGVLDNGDLFGAVGNIGDLNGDGTSDLAIGVRSDDDGGTDRGAVYICFMNSNGTVQSHQKISDTQGGFNGILDDSDFFGFCVDGIGDINGDSYPDIAVGAHGCDDGGADRGAVWILMLDNTGMVIHEAKISDTTTNFTGALDNGDLFGNEVRGIGDRDNNGFNDLIVAAIKDDDGGTDNGAFYIIYLEGCNLQASFSHSTVFQTVNFTDTSPVSTSWWWDFGDGNFSNLQNPSHTYASNGWFWVCLTITDSTGCESTICDSVGVFKNSIELPGLDEVLFYPNPVQDQLQIRLRGDFLGEMEISIIDLQGRKIYSAMESKNGHRFDAAIDMSAMPASVYFAEIRIGDRKVVRKIVK